MNDWTLAITVLVGLLIVALLVVALIRPSGRVKLGVFLEREIDRSELEPWPLPGPDEDTKEIKPDAR